MLTALYVMSAPPLVMSATTHVVFARNHPIPIHEITKEQNKLKMKVIIGPC